MSPNSKAKVEIDKRMHLFTNKSTNWDNSELLGVLPNIMASIQFIAGLNRVYNLEDMPEFTKNYINTSNFNA